MSDPIAVQGPVLHAVHGDAPPAPATSAARRRRTRSLAVRIVASVLIAGAGAAVTQAATAYYSRGNASIAGVTTEIEPVNSLVEIDPMVLLSKKEDTQIAVDDEMVELTARNAWIVEYEPTMPRTTYLSRLEADTGTLREVSEGMARLRKDLPGWPNYEVPNEKHATAMFRIVRDNLPLVEAHVSGEVRRGNSPFPPELLSAAEKFANALQQPGQFYRCSKGSALDDDLPVRCLTIAKDDQKQVIRIPIGRDVRADRAFDCIALAICTGDAAASRHVLTALQKAVDEGPEVRRLLDMIRRQTDRYARWLVRVVVVNDGGRPIPIGDRGYLYVQSRGAKVTKDDGGAAAVSANVRISLDRAEEFSVDIQGVKLRLGFTPTRGPVVVNPGTAVAVPFRSTEFVEKSAPEFQALLQLAREGGAMCKVVLEQAGDDGSRRVVESQPVEFGGAIADRAFPDADTTWAR